jgi:hypothetical protein
MNAPNWRADKKTSNHADSSFTQARPGGWAGPTTQAAFRYRRHCQALVALSVLQPENCDFGVLAGLEWLLRIQNATAAFRLSAAAGLCPLTKLPVAPTL